MNRKMNRDALIEKGYIVDLGEHPEPQAIHEIAVRLSSIFEKNRWHWWNCAHPRTYEIEALFKLLLNDLRSSSMSASGRLELTKTDDGHIWCGLSPSSVKAKEIGG